MELSPSLLPDVLLVTVKRFDSDGQKRLAPVPATKEITFHQVKYELKTIVEHDGDLPNAGHYTMVMRENDTYTRFDDDGWVTELSEREAPPEGYFLFYEKKGIVPTGPEVGGIDEPMDEGGSNSKLISQTIFHSFISFLENAGLGDTPYHTADEEEMTLEHPLQVKIVMFGH